MIEKFEMVLCNITDCTRKNLEETGAYVDADIDSPVSSTKSDSDANSNATHVNTAQKKDVLNQVPSNRRKGDMEISQTSNSGEESPLESNSVVHTKLPPGKVIYLYFNRIRLRKCRRKLKKAKENSYRRLE